VEGADEDVGVGDRLPRLDPDVLARTAEAEAMALDAELYITSQSLSFPLFADRLGTAFTCTINMLKLALPSATLAEL